MKTFRIRVDGQAADVEADSETSLFAASCADTVQPQVSVALVPLKSRSGTCQTLQAAPPQQ